MRLALFAVSLLALTAPAVAQSRDACTMISAEDLHDLLGPKAHVAEEGGAGTGDSLCHWKGEEGQAIRLQSLTAESVYVIETPLADYLEDLRARKQAFGDLVEDIEGPWQAAQIFKGEAENPHRIFTISFINKDDVVNMETYGLDIAVTRDLAVRVAEGM